MAGAKTKAVKFFGADRRMFQQQAANGLRRMPVKLRRPCVASDPQHCPKVALRHAMGMR